MPDVGQRKFHHLPILLSFVEAVSMGASSMDDDGRLRHTKWRLQIAGIVAYQVAALGTS
jgi:hypothetical protein